MKSDFRTVMTRYKIGGEFVYHKKPSKQMMLTIGFMAAKKCRCDVVFYVYVNDEQTAEKACEKTEEEKFIQIPFDVVDGDLISIEVMNCTDVTDLIITRRNISA